MDGNNCSMPLLAEQVRVTDSFWKNKMELVRTKMLPYQWKALNNQVEGAAPSFCMHNFRAAAQKNRQRREMGKQFKEPEYTYRGFERLPDDPKHPEEQFYGYVFQDSDFSKWIEAVGYSLMQYPNEELERTADEAVELVCAAQQEDGYLDTYYILNGKDKIFTNLNENHELYCLGHLIEGAVAYYQATGKDKLLQAAKRYADFAAEHFGEEEGKCKGYPGHEIAEMALIRLYEITGDDKYLKLSRFFIDERGKSPCYFVKEQPNASGGGMDKMNFSYNQAHLPVREQEEAVGHAVRAVYLYSGMADIARITEDESLFAACRKIWDNMVNRKMYITGGIGGTVKGEAFSFNYDLPNDTAYAETCAAIGLIFFARRMLQIKPFSQYADVMERALYNCVLSGMSLDGTEFFYVNPLEVNPRACHKDERKFHVKPVRQKWFGCACCPPNLARLLTSLSAYAYTETEDTLFLHLYIGGIIKKQIQGKQLTVTVTSGFPWDGKVEIEIEGDCQSLTAPFAPPFTLALRIPDWCGVYTLDGVEDAEKQEKDGYLYITKNWRSGEKLSLDFKMEVRIYQADSRVREDIGKAAVAYGPLVYCLEEKDNGKELHLLTLDSDAEAVTESYVIAGEEVLSVLLDGYRQQEEKGEHQLYRPLKKAMEAPVRLRFIPYYAWANRGENEMSVWIRNT